MPDYLNRMINEARKLPPDVALISLDDEGKYWLTTDGRWLSVCGEQPLYRTLNDNGKGYLRFQIGTKKHYLHRYLALALNQSPEKEKLFNNCQVHHLDRDKSNGKLDNLCILSPKKHRAIHNIWRKIEKWEKQQAIMEQTQSQIREE